MFKHSVKAKNCCPYPGENLSLLSNDIKLFDNFVFTLIMHGFVFALSIWLFVIAHHFWPFVQ